MTVLSRKSDRPRMRFLRNRHAEDLRTVASGTAQMSRLHRDANAFNYVAAFDPTHEGMYLHSVIRWLDLGRIRLEDGRRVRDTLARFHARKHRLPEAARDIALYGSPGAIDRLFDAGPASLPLHVPENILDGCTVEAQGEDWMVVAVRTSEAAAYFADSTSWCTRHPFEAETYLAKGPLYVVLGARDRLQFHIQTSQLMDRLDDVPRGGALDIPEAAFMAAAGVVRREVSTDHVMNVTLAIGLEDLAAGRDPKAVMESTRMMHSAGDDWMIGLPGNHYDAHFELHHVETGRVIRVGEIDDWIWIPTGAMEVVRASVSRSKSTTGSGFRPARWRSSGHL